MRRIGFKWVRDRRGNVALIFAVLAPMLILAAGGAVDVTNASMRQAQLQQSVDAAAVAAVARMSPAYIDATTNPATLPPSGSGPITDPNIQTEALAVFNANYITSGDTTVNGFVVTTNLVPPTSTKAATVTSSVQATATFNSSFLGLIGHSTIPLSATSSGSDNIPAYINFYILLDNTPSMGLGATQADVNIMTAHTPDGCAFACHTTNDPGENYYNIAKIYGANMRIDIVRSATQTLTQSAYSIEQGNKIPNEFQMSIYDFGQNVYVSPVATLVSALTPNITTQTYNDAGAVDVEYVPGNNYAYNGTSGQVPQTSNNDEDTDFDAIFTSMLNVMLPINSKTNQRPSSGNGSTAAAPQQVLFFVTDGMVDMNNGGSRLMGGINPATCTKLKNSGVQIAILYTTYLLSAINTDPTGWSQANTAPVLSKVEPALVACASPGLFQQVTPDDSGTTDGSIDAAMQALLIKVVASVKITG